MDNNGFKVGVELVLKEKLEGIRTAVKSIENLTSTLTDLNKKIATSMKNVNKLLTGIGAQYNAVVQSIISKSKSVQNAFKSLTNSFKSIGNGVVEFGSKSIKAFTSLIGWSKRLNEEIMRTSRTITIGLGTALASMGRNAMLFEKELVNANAMLGETKEGLKQVSNEILELSNKYGMSSRELAGSLYNIGSAGYRGAEAMEFLNMATKASIAGNANMSTVIDAATYTMTNYGMSVKDLTKIYDLQFNAVKYGVITYEKLANGVGNVAGAAKDAGVSIEEMYALIAFSTKRIPAEEAITSVRSFLANLKKRADELEKININIYTDEGKLKSLSNIASDLRAQFEGLTQKEIDIKLGDLGFDIREAKLISALLSDQKNELGYIVDRMNEQNSLQDALNEKMDTFNTKFNILKSTVGNTFLLLGQEILDSLAEPLDNVILIAKAFFNTFKNNKELRQNLIQIGIDILGITAKVYLLSKAFALLTSPILYFAGLAYLAYASWEGDLFNIRTLLETTGEAFSKFFSKVRDENNNISFDRIKDELSKVKSYVDKFLIETNSKFAKQNSETSLLALVGSLTASGAIIGSVIPGIGTAIGALTGLIMGNIIHLLGYFHEELMALEKYIQEFSWEDFGRNMYNSTVQWLNKLAQPITDMVNNTIISLKAMWEDFIDWWQGFSFKDMVSDFGTSLKESVIEAFKNFSILETIGLKGGKSKGFATGGYTGDGNKYDVAGIVHKGEYVIPKWMVEDNPDMISQLESQRKGYAEGGYVGGLANFISPAMQDKERFFEALQPLMNIEATLTGTYDSIMENMAASQEQIEIEKQQLEALKSLEQDKGAEPKSLLKQLMASEKFADTLYDASGALQEFGDLIKSDLLSTLGSFSSSMSRALSSLQTFRKDFGGDKFFDSIKGIFEGGFTGMFDSMKSTFSQLSGAFSQGGASGLFGQIGSMMGGAGGITNLIGGIGSMANIGSAVITGVSALQGYFNKGLEAHNAEQKNIFAENTKAIEELTNRIAQSIEAQEGFINTLIKRTALMPTVGNLQQGTGLLADLEKIVMANKDFGSLNILAKYKKKSFFKSSSRYENINISQELAGILGGFDFKGKTMEALNLDELKEYRKSLDNITQSTLESIAKGNIPELETKLEGIINGIGSLGGLTTALGFGSYKFQGFESNLEQFKEAVDQYIKQIENLQQAQKDFAKKATFEAFQGISILDADEIRKDAEKTLKDMGLDPAKYQDWVNDVVEQSKVLVNAMNDVRQNTIDSFVNNNLTMGEAFVNSMSSYFDKIKNNIGQVFFDKQMGKYVDSLNKEFEKIATSLFDFKMSEDSTQNLSDVLDFKQIFKDLKFASQEGQKFDKVLEEIIRQAREEGITDAMLEQLGILKGEALETANTIKNALSNAMKVALDEGDFISFSKSLGQSIYESVKDSLIKAFVESASYQKLLDKFFDLGKIEAEIAGADSFKEAYDIIQKALKEIENELRKEGLDFKATGSSSLGSSITEDWSEKSQSIVESTEKATIVNNNNYYQYDFSNSTMIGTSEEGLADYIMNIIESREGRTV